MTAPARVRIGSFKLKSNGLRVVRLKDGAERTYVSIMQEMRDLLGAMKDEAQPPVGFAIVVWTADGTSSATARTYPGSPILHLQVPDFVRERLMAERICEWAGD